MTAPHLPCFVAWIIVSRHGIDEACAGTGRAARPILRIHPSTFNTVLGSPIPRSSRAARQPSLCLPHLRSLLYRKVKRKANPMLQVHGR
jgi:hypothetical protein